MNPKAQVPTPRSLPPTAFLEIIDLLKVEAMVEIGARRFDRELSRLDNVLVWREWLTRVPEPKSEVTSTGRTPTADDWDRLAKILVRLGAERALSRERLSATQLSALLLDRRAVTKLLRRCRRFARLADKQALGIPLSSEDQAVLSRQNRGSISRFDSPFGDWAIDEDKRDYRNAVEAVECLVDPSIEENDPPGPFFGTRAFLSAKDPSDDRTLTEIALGADEPGAGGPFAEEGDETLVPGVATPTHSILDGQREPQREVRSQVSGALFSILKEIGVSLRPEKEVELATKLLQRLAGQETIERFRELNNWLKDFRLRQPDTRMVRRIRWLFPRLNDHDGSYYWSLSFRLFLKSRLRDFCRDHSKELQTDPAQFELLSRERIGELMQNALADASQLPLPVEQAPAITMQSLAAVRQLLATDA